MADPSSAFAKLVPGFDFLQGLMKNAGGSLPTMGQWIAPTLDPEELEKRIRDLRTVQFWLEQNANMIGTTIQALEVQRMTLTTLKTMNVPIDAMRESMKMRDAEPPSPFAAFGPAPSRAPTPAPAPAPQPEPTPAAPEAASDDEPAPARPAAPGADPMQWWTALTQQFGELAAKAMKDLPVPAMPAASPAAKSAGSAKAAKAATSRAGARTGPASGTQAGARKAAKPAAKSARPAASGAARPAAKTRQR
jgi:hypothetical protein